MSDRELLEKAAKAAGIEIGWIDPVWGDPERAYFHLPGGKLWNPLTDDGDALRLAVKLNLHVLVMEKSVFVHSDPDSLLSFPSVSEMEMTGGDPYAATRRAVVRAAAALAPSADTAGQEVQR